MQVHVQRRMHTDELNSTILDNEVLAVDMGVNITNLTDKINIHFKNVKYDGIPSCRSWNSEGVRPQWIDDGCETVISDGGITCQCSHLTFFSILLTPLNETISSPDLNNLTTITQVGCGLSMFFLCIALFMHYLLRKTKATITTKILIHLLWAMLLLNLTFLINASVANLNHTVGCKIMAAAMHYFMLATLTWFAMQAFHLCLQMYSGGKILIKRYVLKVSVTSWGIPSLIVIVLLSVDKYGQQVIHTDEGANNVKMCWITDGDVQYIVNIGYYALIFVFTFSTLVIILTWFLCLKRTNSESPQGNRSGINMMTVMGLCCLLGVTWAFAFFAYGVLRIPSYYIFTVLNSFQGFFLFIYYYTNSNVKATSTSPSVGVSSSSSSSSSSNTTATTLGKGLSFLENPYSNLPEKKTQASEDG
ncbi:adhesion G-protein coupled receptor G2-like [Solea solea]|uniref:adhesion G-protein coupled receptor G2-like n=1 Tax=Solea solea TaxID=90069 RepID=UPI00272B9D51|nr:adhesion G-protein coupled receptor G2-like [Solea solea]